MQSREVAELAALVSTQGPQLIQAARPLGGESLNTYWAVSKARMDRWCRLIKEFSAHSLELTPEVRSGHWQQVRVAIEEILVGEILTRVFAAVAVGVDRRSGCTDSEPVVRSVLISHCEARHRGLRLLVHGHGVPTQDALELNRLRQRCERWTDVLIGYLLGSEDVAELSADPQRAAEFGRDFADRDFWDAGQQAWTVMLASLQNSVELPAWNTGGGAYLTSQICLSVANCCRLEMLSGGGLSEALWLSRLEQFADETQDMIDRMYGSV